MGLCASKSAGPDAVNTPGRGGDNRGRVRRLSMAMDADVLGDGGSVVPDTKARPSRRLSVISGDGGGDTAFDCDQANATFFDGAQLSDGRTVTDGDGVDPLQLRPPDWLRLAAASRAGHDGMSRKINQDAYVVSPHFQDNTEQLLVGVFDGHGAQGHHASRLITRILPDVVGQHLPADGAPLSLERHTPAMVASFHEVEQALVKSHIDVTLSGSTAVVGLLRGRALLLANAGDSRAVVGVQQGKAVVARALTVDHKPDDEREKQRIERMHGTCKPMYDAECNEFIGPVRVWSRYYDCRSPGIAMSRSIGDMIAAEVGVICEPECTLHTVDMNTDRVFVFASDGVWEFLTDQQVVDIAMRYFGQPKAAADALCDAAHKAWSDEEEVIDDITVIVMFIDPPKSSHHRAAVAAAAATSPSAAAAGAAGAMPARSAKLPANTITTTNPLTRVPAAAGK